MLSLLLTSASGFQLASPPAAAALSRSGRIDMFYQGSWVKPKVGSKVDFAQISDGQARAFHRAIAGDRWGSKRMLDLVRRWLPRPLEADGRLVVPTGIAAASKNKL